MGTQLRSPGRVVGALQHGAISPASLPSRHFIVSDLSSPGPFSSTIKQKRASCHHSHRKWVGASLLERGEAVRAPCQFIRSSLQSGWQDNDSGKATFTVSLKFNWDQVTVYFPWLLSSPLLSFYLRPPFLFPPHFFFLPQAATGILVVDNQSLISLN